MDTPIENALKKAKRKQLLKIVLISIIVVLVLLPIIYKTGNYFAAKSSMKLHESLYLHNHIAEPNIQIDSRVISNSSMFGGTIVTNRSKNINGYLVQWSTLTSSYDWFGINIDYNELMPGFFESNKGFYEFDKQTKKKVATFYHPAIKEYYNIQNELEEIAQMKNYVAEVAISFDQPYKLKEIQEKIPENLNIVWLYMTSAISNEQEGPSGTTIYGFDPADFKEDGYVSFINALEKYDKSGENEAIQEFLNANKDKQFADVEILGVMLTGQTTNFKELINQDFIRGASVGATAQMVPYMKPEK